MKNGIQNGIQNAIFYAIFRAAMVDEPVRIPKYGAENRVGINGTITIRELYKYR
ncbi:MAG: hypothetical protein QXV37_00235 [Candidatus Jordarchaeaceae archaeon]